MKRVIFFLMFFSFFSFVLASVDVNNYTVKDFYFVDERLQGEIDLNIFDEKYGQEIFSNQGHSMLFEDFLVANGVNFECTPSDCSMGYSYSNGASDKTVTLSSPAEKYVGFVLEGGDIVLDSLSFNLASNFEEEITMPLSMEFFEKERWGFNHFSDTYLEKNWGCYDSSAGSEDALVGDSFYCEMISIQDSGSLTVGAQIGGLDTGVLTMSVYPESGTGSSWECEFDPNAEESCIVSPEAGIIFSEGDYQVCVGADFLTSYKIYTEETGDNCGFVYGNPVGGSTKDYAVFAQSTKYADANFFGWTDFDYEKIVEEGNELIQEKYGGDCSSGCILPIAFSGTSQVIGFSNIELIYTEDLEWRVSNNIYDLESIPAKVDFSGVLDLELLDFIIDEAGEFVLSFGEELLFDDLFEIVPAPIILSVLPLTPPFGVSIKFYANVDFETNKSLTYKWDFGDGSNVLTTTEPNTYHKYENSGNYTLSLIVSAGGNLTSEKEFTIMTISPKMSIFYSLNSKKESLSNVQAFIASLPSWYGDKILDILDTDAIGSDLSRLERLQNDTTNEADLKKIAGELFALSTPSVLGIDTISSPYFMTNLEDVDIEPVEIIAGSVSGATNDLYARSILLWQNNNVQVSYSEKKASISYDDGSVSDVMKIYDIDIISLGSDESYFVINRPFSELFFKEDVGERKAGDATVVILEPGIQKKIEFYYEAADPTAFFVSPKLGSLIIEEDIEENCNYNLVCEEANGETWVNCRTDCKPVGRTIVYSILGILFCLALYTALQIWYKKRYENYLFKDAAQLYNLLMYVSNARARGMKDLRIETNLRSKGWSSERVNYVMKKSRGKRTGMIEIVPISFISAYLRDRKAANKQKMKVATAFQQQGGGNINKSGMQRNI
ncbi:PKD domain-containing protein [Methanococcoides sp. SA1]|nr:PKD domain-containing protein [Methanococcoides sp. SA1]